MDTKNSTRKCSKRVIRDGSEEISSKKTRKKKLLSE